MVVASSLPSPPLDRFRPSASFAPISAGHRAGPGGQGLPAADHEAGLLARRGGGAPLVRLRKDRRQHPQAGIPPPGRSGLSPSAPSPSPHPLLCVCVCFTQKKAPTSAVQAARARTHPRARAQTRARAGCGRRGSTSGTETAPRSTSPRSAWGTGPRAPRCATHTPRNARHTLPFSLARSSLARFLACPIAPLSRPLPRSLDRSLSPPSAPSLRRCRACVRPPPPPIHPRLCVAAQGGGRPRAGLRVPVAALWRPVHRHARRSAPRGAGGVRARLAGTQSSSRAFIFDACLW